MPGHPQNAPLAIIDLERAQDVDLEDVRPAGSRLGCRRTRRQDVPVDRSGAGGIRHRWRILRVSQCRSPLKIR
jgi:hypothetical protein